MQKPIECALECPLGQTYHRGDELVEVGSSFSMSEGKPKFGVAIFGESLGLHEAQEGGPFRRNGESGSLITKIIEDLTVFDPSQQKHRKMQRSDFVWDNVIKCRPPNDELQGKSYEKEAIRCCSQYNSRSIGLDDVRVILALGGVAFRTLTGIEGKKRTIEDCRGYVFKSDYGLVIPSIHPSFIRHGNARYTNALIYDVKKALLVASGKYSSYDLHGGFKGPKFIKEGKLEALVSLYYKLKSEPQLTIFYDIENPYSKLSDKDEEDKGEEEEDEQSKRSNGKESDYEITSIQFAYSKDWAITVPWEKPFIKVALAILSLENEKVGSNNWHHDNPRLEKNGALIGGMVHDAMWAWHHLQPGLWKRLQRIGSFFDCPLIWKHFALDEGLEDEYGGWDVISLAYIWEKLPARMKQMGVWDSYLKFKVELRSKVLKPTEIRGFFVSGDEHSNFEGWIKDELTREDTKLQAETPRELRSIKPSRKNKFDKTEYGYVREPRAITELRAGYEETRAKMLARGVLSANIIPFEKWAERKTGLTLREFEGTRREDFEELSLDEGVSSVRRWCKVEPFRTSSKQLIKYLKFKGYNIPRTLKTNKETTGKKELQELWEKTQDELLGSVIRLRSYNKMLTNDIPNWIPDKDGVVRTSFLFDPPSWQLNSRSPNIQNASKHAKEWELIGKTASELIVVGQRFRRIVTAPKGRCVVEFDKTAFHFHTMAFEARDALYLKWSPYMHDLLTSHIVGEPIDPYAEIDRDKLSYIKKKFKQVRNSQAKPAGLGNQLGLGARKLFHMNRTYIDEQGVRQIGIESEKKAIWLQSLIKELFPKVHKAKRAFMEEAHNKTYLLSEYGAIHWFFDVMRWDWKSRSMKNGSEAEKAIGFKVQQPAFGMMHSELLDIANTSDFLEEHWFGNTVHDSFVFFPEIGKRDRCIEEITRYMRKRDKVLSDSVIAPDGLFVDVEVMASPDGGNWANYNKEWNPMGIQEVKI